MRSRTILSLSAAALIGSVGVGLLLSGEFDPAQRLKGATEATKRLEIRTVAASEVEFWPGRQYASWLDENTLAFVGKAQVSSKETSRTDIYPSAIYTWKLGSAPQPYTAARWPGGADYLCAENGVITYSAEPFLDPPDKGAPVRVMSGALGREQVNILRPSLFDRQYNQTLQANFNAHGSASVSGRRCRFDADPKKANRWWVANYSQSLRLDIGANFQIGSIVLEPPTGGERRELSIPASHVSPYRVETPAWDDSLVLWSDPRGDSNTVQAAQVVRVYRISKNGDLSSIEIQNTLALRGSRLIPYRDGYVVIIAGDGVPGLGGLYLVQGGKLRKVLSGAFAPVAVSPSGCRVAISDYGKNLPEVTTLKVIQLCKS